jgi:hypothetical protein
MRPRWIGVIVAAGLLATGLAVGAASGNGSGGVDPADFTSPVPNAYFPLEPGTVYRYRGEEDGERFRERVVVTDRTREVAGVTTTVIVDVLKVDGLLAERTKDWYAAANDGTVWYFGEDTAEYDEAGRVISTEGSWEAGVDGAVAGIIMPAEPVPTVAYRQEYYKGQAEDQAWVVQRNAQVTVPYGHLEKAVRTLEWSRLEPRVVVVKFYAPELGLVSERVRSGGAERLELVQVTTPA